MKTPSGPSVPQEKMEGLERQHGKQQCDTKSRRGKMFDDQTEGRRGESRADEFNMAVLDPYENLHKETSC